MHPELKRRPEPPPPLSETSRPCHCCGFLAGTERRQAAIAGRLRPVCSVCDDALHLESADLSRYRLAWLPEIGQERVAHLARTAVVAPYVADTPAPKDKENDLRAFDAESVAYMARCNPGDEVPRAIFDAVICQGSVALRDGIKARCTFLMETLGVRTAAEALRWLADLAPDDRAEALSGIRLVPRAFRDADIAAWREGASPYAEIDGAALHRAGGFIDG